MSKVRSVFRCSECGGASPKWVGRCPSCSEWNTLVEELDEPTPGRGPGRRPALERAVPIAEVDADEWQPRSTGLSEVDRVLSGGLVPGLGHARRRRARHRQVHAAVAGGGGHGDLRGERRSTSRPRNPSSRCACGPNAWARSRPACSWPARPPSPTSSPTSTRCSPTLLVVDSIQTVYEPELELGPGLGGAGARVRGACSCSRPRPATSPPSSSATSPRTAASPVRGCSSTSSTPCSPSRAIAITPCGCCGRPSTDSAPPTSSACSR